MEGTELGIHSQEWSMSNFSCSPSRNITSHSIENLGDSLYLTQMEDDYTTNTHYLTYTFLLKKVGRMYFWNLEVKGLRWMIYFLFQIFAEDQKRHWTRNYCPVRQQH